jgi:hypothetical protein
MLLRLLLKSCLHYRMAIGHVDTLARISRDIEQPTAGIQPESLSANADLIFPDGQQ